METIPVVKTETTELELTNEEFNDMLTIEGMLQVVDATSGESVDVRQMLAIKDEDIKSDTLRASIKSVVEFGSIKDSIKSEQITEQLPKMGEYLEKLDFIEIDMGRAETEEEEKTLYKESKWS